MGRRPTSARKPAPWRILQLTFLCYFIALPPPAHGHVTTVSASDTSGAIQFSGSWVPAKLNGDGSGLGGPNSSVCAMGDSSRYTTFEGDSFSFRFRGISAQLVLTSRPDHSPFTVDFDGQTFSGDTYSQVVGCGVAWSSPRASVIGEHTVTCTNHPTGGRLYLEILSVRFDDGSDLPPPPAPPAPKPTTSKAITHFPTVSTQSKTPVSIDSKTSVSAQSTSVSSIAGHPNVPSAGGNATDIENLSETRGPGGRTVTILTITQISPTGIIPPPPASQESSASQRRSGPTVVAIGVSTALGILLLLLLLTMWRRRQIRRQRQTAVHPLTMPAQSLSASTSDSADSVASPSRDKSAASGSPIQPLSASVTHASMRLADEDIDRIALRMHDMIDVHVRHRRTDSSSTLNSGGHATTLPPYFTTSSAT